MNTQDAPCLLACGARFTTETRCVGRQVDRQRTVQYLIAMEIGHRNFSSRDEPEIINFAMIHVLCHFGKLARAAHGGTVHDKGRQQFRIAMFFSMEVEHILNQAALKLGAHALEEREARTCDLDAARKVKKT